MIGRMSMNKHISTGQTAYTFIMPKGFVLITF